MPLVQESLACYKHNSTARTWTDIVSIPLWKNNNYYVHEYIYKSELAQKKAQKYCVHVHPMKPETPLTLFHFDIAVEESKTCHTSVPTKLH